MVVGVRSGVLGVEMKTLPVNTKRLDTLQPAPIPTMERV